MGGNQGWGEPGFGGNQQPGFGGNQPGFGGNQPGFGGGSGSGGNGGFTNNIPNLPPPAYYHNPNQGFSGVNPYHGASNIKDIPYYQPS